MKKINKNEVVNAIELVAVNGMKLVGYALGAMLIGMSTSTSRERNVYVNRDNRKGTVYVIPRYHDVIETIMSSCMLDTFKDDAISIIKKDESSSYYKSVISIVNSNMLDTFKLDAIKKIS